MYRCVCVCVFYQKFPLIQSCMKFQGNTAVLDKSVTNACMTWCELGWHQHIGGNWMQLLPWHVFSLFILPFVTRQHVKHIAKHIPCCTPQEAQSLCPMTAAGTGIHAGVVADMVRSDAPGAAGTPTCSWWTSAYSWYSEWMFTSSRKW